MKKILVTTSRSFLKYPDLVEKIQKHHGVFVENFIEDLGTVKELFDHYEKILMLDELNVKGDFQAVNKILDRFVGVKYICGLSARYHEFDLKKASRLGITYCNNPNTTSQSVAELSLMHLCMLVRNQPLYHRSDFGFFGMNHLGRELNSLRVGVLGYGSIGAIVARLCSSLGMEVKIWSRSRKDCSYQQVPFRDLMKQEVIFISVVSGEESKALFDKDFFRLLSKDQYVVDIVGDDQLYDRNRLIRMCNEKKLAGYAFEAESPKSKYLEATGNVSESPHVGWGTEESYRRLIEGWVSTTLAAYKGEPIHVVG